MHLAYVFGDKALGGVPPVAPEDHFTGPISWVKAKYAERGSSGYPHPLT